MNTRTIPFFIAMVLQTALLLSMALPQPELGSGVIRLAIEPGITPTQDEYQVFTPRFDIQRPEEAPGWRDLPVDTPICVVLVPGEDGFHAVESVRTRWPWWTPRKAVVIRGFTTLDGLRLDGLTTYGVHLWMREWIADAPERPHAEVAVSPDGRARIRNLVVDGFRY